MNAPSKDNLDADGDELSTVDDDFDSLLEKEDIGIGSEKGKHNLSFNELFEQISEECTESVEGLAGDSPEGNVDDDFEALLNDQDHIVTDLDNENFSENNAGKDDDLLGKMSFGIERDSTGGNVDDDFEALLNDQDHIVTDLDNENFSENNAGKDDDLLDDSQEFLQNSSDEIKTMNSNVDPELGKSLVESSVLEERTYQDKIEALNKLLIEERSSFQHDLKKKEIEASKLKAEIEKLREKVKIIETDKDAAEEKIFNLFEKQKINSHITEVKEMSLDRETELISQITILKEKIEVQDDIILEIQEDNTLIRNKNVGILDKKKNINYNSDDEDKPEDPKQKIVLLENELEDQKEVSEKLKAYVGDVLENIMVTNPQMLERK
eukprot:GFUD01007350.1.p1 GENE.GFUD01007350.1~~GFUD01007350.1.p1  ORF type:complete len:381 (-),score=128.23 GFUD01007350.1:55-1197(-)